MEEPAGIPKDVWEAAYDAHQLILNTAIPTEAGAILRIARAIMAEREACAQVADAERAYRQRLSDEENKDRIRRQALSAQAFVSDIIALAIRDRDATKHPSWGDREPFSPVPEPPSMATVKP